MISIASKKYSLCDKFWRLDKHLSVLWFLLTKVYGIRLTMLTIFSASCLRIIFVRWCNVGIQLNICTLDGTTKVYYVSTLSNISISLLTSTRVTAIGMGAPRRQRLQMPGVVQVFYEPMINPQACRIPL